MSQWPGRELDPNASLWDRQAVKHCLPLLLGLVLALSIPARAGSTSPTSKAPDKEGSKAPVKKGSKARVEKGSKAPVKKGSKTSRSALRKQARQLRKKGQLLAKAQRFDEALVTYAKALEVYAAYPLVHNEIGVVHFQKGRYIEAAESFRKALDLYPGLSAAWANLAECDRKRGRFGESARNYKEFIARRPKVADGYYGLAVVLAADKNKQGALWAMKRFVAMGKRAGAQKLEEVRLRISSYEREGIVAKDVLGIADAIAAYADRKRLKRAKKRTALRAHSGDEHYAAKRYVQALDAYMVLLKKNKASKDPALRYKIGVTFAALRDYRAAMRWWSQALELAPRRDIIFEHMVLAAMKAAAHGQMELGSLGPDTEHLKRAYEALSNGQPALALMLVGEPGDARSTYLKGRAALEGGNLVLARACFESLHSNHETDIDISLALAKTLFRMKEGDKARAILSQHPELKETSEQSVLLREVAVLPENLSTVLPTADGRSKGEKAQQGTVNDGTHSTTTSGASKAVEWPEAAKKEVAHALRTAQVKDVDISYAYSL